MSQRTLNALYEIKLIINNLSEREASKIPVKFIDLINEYANNDYISSIRFDIPLDRQELLPETRLLIKYIYDNYLEEKN